MSRPRSMTQLLEQVLRDYSDGVNTMIPGAVQRVETRAGNLHRVDVLPLVMADYTDEDGDQVIEALPVVPAVPVVMPGAGGYRMTFPVEKGDTVMLVFSQASLDKWLAVGGGPVDPGDFQRFHLSDAVAVPGLRDFAHPWASSPMDRMTLGRDLGAQIEILANEIKLGQLAINETFMAAPFLTAFGTLITAIATAVGTSGTPAGATASATAIGTALTDFLLPLTQAGYKTTVTKVS